MIRTLLILVTFGFTSICIPMQSSGQVLKKDKTGYKVVINHEEQYSIWPANEVAPKGWKDTKIRGNQAKCRQYIEEVWTDMRPLSIRRMNLPDNSPYMVIINHEEQYSIWPEELALPRHWKAVGFKGDLAKCNKYIEEVWTDMRPLSVRKRGN